MGTELGIAVTIEATFAAAAIVEPVPFTAAGATQPIYGGSTEPVAAFLNGKTITGWETHEYVSDRRWLNVRTWNHAADDWGRVYTVGPSSLASAGDDDDHGVHSVAYNADGRAVVAWGNHDGSFNLATQSAAGDDSLWVTLTGGLNGNYTYPHLFLDGSTLRCNLRKNYPIGDPTYADGAKTLVTRPITFAGSVATVGAETELVIFGNDSRVYQGNVVPLASGRFAQCLARANFGDTFREDVYYIEYDFVNGRGQSLSGATVNFPISRANMDSVFRVRDTASGSVVQAAALLIEGARTHIIFPEGLDNGQSQTVFHIIGTAGVFAAPVDTGVRLTSDADSVRLINGPGGSLQLHYLRQPSAPSGRGGNHYMRSLAAGGAANAWGPEQLITEVDPTRFQFTQLGAVFNADLEIRMIIWEGAQSAADSAAHPGKRGYAWGDSGFKGKSRPVVADPPADLNANCFWFEADPAFVFSDALGTVPATLDVREVRAIRDKFGNGHMLVLEGTEPGTLRLDDGVYWIDVGDEISPTTSFAATAFAGASANAYFGSVAARDWQSAANATDVAIMDDGTGSDRLYRLVRNGSQAPQPIALSNAGSGTNVPTSTTANSIRHNDDFLLSLHVNGTPATSYLNGVQLGTATVATNPDPDAMRPRLGANAALTSTSYMRGRFYSWLHYAGNLDLTARQAVMDYQLSKMPR
jgi:hypothetical protein